MWSRDVPNRNAVVYKATLNKKDEFPQCAYCSMKAVFSCDVKGCLTPLCYKHVNRTSSGDYCREHKALTFTPK